MPAVIWAQNSVTFSPVISPGTQSPANSYAVDVNNDGLTDIVQDGGQLEPGLTVSINNGNGTFKAAVSYTLPGSPNGPNCIAAADYNNDGNVDLAVPLEGTKQIAVYLGKGDGTFQAPVLSTINLPSGYEFSMAGCAPADFNADGDIDLAVWTNNGYGSPSAVTELYVLKGEGSGSFSANPYPVLAGTSLQPFQQIFIGDYDSDGKADIAATTSIEDYSSGITTSATIHVLYGNNNFTFNDTAPYTSSGNMNIGSGDLNSDGYTDLWVLGGERSVTQELGIFYGDSSRTFGSYWMTTPASNPVGASPASWYFQPQLTMADYNGDGHMDLVGDAVNSNFDPGYMEFFLSNGEPGEFTPQVISLPYSYDVETEPVAGLFNNSYLKPDATLDQSPSTDPSPSNTPYLTAELNQATSGYFGPCEYPKSGEGFNACVGGGVTGNTVQFSAAANSFGQLRKIELWVDGAKVSEQHHTWGTHAYFDYSSTFSNGTHQATFYAADVDNRLQRYAFSFTVGAACSAFPTPGVHVCGPGVNGESSPVQALATATITGTLARMEVWLDGVKQYTETSSTTLNTSLQVSPGTHSFEFYAVNTAGTKWETIINTTTK
jgi:FG-GAP-like repeat